MPGGRAVAPGIGIVDRFVAIVAVAYVRALNELRGARPQPVYRLRDQPVAVARLSQAASLYRGPFLNGIAVDEFSRTSDHDILAAGDCTSHHSPIYDRRVRLESVQNAVDQAINVAA